MRAWRIRFVSLALLAASAGVARPARAQLAPVPVQAAVDPAPLFRDILTRFYQAYARKDLPAIEALWHPKGPARHGRNVIAMEFELKTATLLGVSVTDASITPGGGRARVITDLDLLDAKTKRTRHERRVREVTFLQDEGTWKIWNDGAGGLGMQIAARLLEASPDQRAALIANDPEARSNDALTGVGLHVNRLRSQGKYAEVLDALAVRAQLARALGEEAVLAASLLDRGLVYQVIGRNDDAWREYSAARDLFVSVGTRGEVAILDSNLGAVEYLRGDYASAAVRYRSALDVFESENDTPRLASTLHGLGNALYMQGDFEAAMASYQRCLVLHETSGDKYSASSVLQAIGVVHKEVGSYAAAIDAYTRSAALSGDAKDTSGAARAEHSLGEIHRLLGDYARALQHFAKSLASWEKVDDPPNRASTMYATGQVHALQRGFPRAIEWYQRALELDQQANVSVGIARDLGGLGGAHAGQGQLELALSEYRKSLAIREKLKDAPGTMWTVVHIGVLQSGLGLHSDALESYHRGLGLAESSGDAGAVCTIHALRAANELNRDDLEAALASARRAAEMATRLEMFDVLANAKVTAGKVQRKSGRIGEAIASLQDAISASDRVPTGPGVETFFDDRRSPYLALIDLLASENDAPASRAADAFLLSERARTRNLASMLGGDGAVVVKDMTQAERDEERQLTKAIKTLGVRLKRERGRAKPNPDHIAALTKDVERAQADRVAFRQRLFAAHPSLPVLRAQSGAAGIEGAGRTLARSEVLLSFVVLEQKTHVFLVPPAGSDASGGRALNLETIDIKAGDLAAKVALFRDAVARREERAADVGRELHALLIAPVRDALRRAKSVVVLPDAFLWGLPFEALQDERGRYLVQDLAISYAPSLTALSAMRSIPPPDGGGRPALLALSDPVIPAAALDRLALVRSPSSAPFPRSAHEVEALAAVFGPRASQVLTKAQARADRLSGVRSGTALHLAVPGCLLETSPLFSLLALSPGKPDDADQGLVEIGDAIGWSLPASVVTVSRMEASGGGFNGEGLTGLAWSLYIAGAGSLVVNRWLPQENDAKTMTAFYRAWLGRAGSTSPRPTPAGAMQKAARALIAVPGAQPADWAGFMVLGRN